MLELASRGHQVTEVTPTLESKVVPNYTQLAVEADTVKSTGENSKGKRTGKFKLTWSEIYLF
jgi:hypothetical protein